MPGWASRTLLSHWACSIILFREPRALSKIIPVLEKVKPERLRTDFWFPGVKDARKAVFRGGWW